MQSSLFGKTQCQIQSAKVARQLQQENTVESGLAKNTVGEDVAVEVRQSQRRMSRLKNTPLTIIVDRIHGLKHAKGRLDFQPRDRRTVAFPLHVPHRVCRAKARPTNAAPACVVSFKFAGNLGAGVELCSRVWS